MNGKTAIAGLVVIVAALFGYLYFQGAQKNDALKPLISGAVLECSADLEFLNKCDALIKAGAGEEEAVLKTIGGEKYQLQAKMINDLLRAGIDGEKKKILTVISDKIDSYNAMLAYVFYTGNGAGNVSISKPSDPPATGEMIRDFERLSAMLGK